MLRRVFFGVVGISLLALSGMAVRAQTGPASAPIGQSPAAAHGFTAEKAAAYLRRQGHSAEVQPSANGVTVVKAQVQKNGWRFAIEIFFTADPQRPGVRFVDFICPLGEPRTQFSSAQLLELMKLNKMIVTHFYYREADQRLCLMTANYSTAGMTEAAFQQILDGFTKVVQDTYSAWDPNRWPVNGMPAKS